MNSHLAALMLCLFGLILSSHSHAGQWGENWGTMVWGSGGGVTAPPAPVITGTNVSFDSITVSFTVDGDGGSPITEYTVTCGTRSATGSDSPITVTGLDSGSDYSCSVVATNAIGSSPSSPAADTSTAVLRRLNIPLIKAAVDAQAAP